MSNNITALVAAQAHSPKQDRAVVISARNFIRAMGGSAGLAIASAIFSNTLISSVSLVDDIPEYYVDEVKNSVFEMPNISNLTDLQQVAVLDCYVKAARSVFYLWAGAMACCLILMVFIKDKGLNRKEEVKAEPAGDSSEDNGDTKSKSAEVAGDAEKKVVQGDKSMV